MTKKEYQKPVMKVKETDIEEQILAGYVTSLTTTGLDEDDLTLPEEEEEEPMDGNIWEDAW